MGRKPNLDFFIPPEVACYGNAFARKWQNSQTNLRTYWSWWQLFFTAAVSCFRWVNLPQEIDARFMEMSLFFNGSVALTQRTPSRNVPVPFVVAPFATEGMLDCYNNPNRIRLTTANGQQFLRNAQIHAKRTGNQYGTRTRLLPADAAICWDSVTRAPLFNAIDLACRRLAEFDVTIDQHVRAERTPYIFYVPEEGRANAEQMYNDIDSGKPAIYLAPTATGVIQAQVFQTGVSYVADKLLNDELKIVAQTFTLLGVDNNAAAEKKERVQTAETVANNEQFLLQRESRMRARKEFCERVGRTFGLVIDVEWAVPHTWESGSASEAYDESQHGMTSPNYHVHEPLLPGKDGAGNAGNAL